MERLRDIAGVIVDKRYMPQLSGKNKELKKYLDSNNDKCYIACISSSSQLSMISGIIESEGYECEVFEDKSLYHLFAWKPESGMKLNLKI